MDRIKSGKYRKWNISRMTLMVGVGAAVVGAAVGGAGGVPPLLRKNPYYS